MAKVYKKEIHGVLKNGERIYLGTAKFPSVEELEKFLGTLAETHITWFNIHSNLYFKDAFAGIQVQPFTDEELND